MASSKCPQMGKGRPLPWDTREGELTVGLKFCPSKKRKCSRAGAGKQTVIRKWQTAGRQGGTEGNTTSFFRLH